jgi:methylase of polypeptide subunit release factors
MSKNEKNHWEKKYSGERYEPNRNPSALLTEWLNDRSPGKALDFASGTGRNALYLAEKGYDVTAVEISPLAIKLAEQAAEGKGVQIKWIVADLDDYVIQEQ